MTSLLRLGVLHRLPQSSVRGIQEFWRGSILDPSASGKAIQANQRSGDAWPACILRLKSFQDLHKLWYICLKEKNLLMSERQACRSYGVHMWKAHGRLKKVKLTMKRILTVVSRRAIHEQCVRAREILSKQKQRESLETRLFILNEEITKLQDKIALIEQRSVETTDRPLSSQLWKVAVSKFERQKQKIEDQLVPLRKDTTQLVSADWRLTRKYSDMPGVMRWKKPWVRALEDRPRSLVTKH